MILGKSLRRIFEDEATILLGVWTLIIRATLSLFDSSPTSSKDFLGAPTENGFGNGRLISNVLVKKVAYFVDCLYLLAFEIFNRSLENFWRSKSSWLVDWGLIDSKKKIYNDEEKHKSTETKEVLYHII